MAHAIAEGTDLNTGKRAPPTAKDADDAIAALTKRFDEFTSRFGPAVQEWSRSARDTYADQTRAVQNAASQGYDAVRRTSRRQAENVSSQIEQNPFTSVLVGVGIGFALGFIAGRL